MTLSKTLHGYRLASLVGLLSVVPVGAKAVELDLFELPLEELVNIRVITASSYEQTIQDAPAVMMVITRQEMLEYGANNLLEVLQRFPGFLPVADLTFGQRGAALRGDTNISGERVLTLINGRPYKSLVTSVYTTRSLYETFPLESIERIELIRGPGSVIYGTNAMTGVINIITRQDRGDTLEVSAKTGSFDSTEQGLRSAFQRGEVSGSLALKNKRSGGWQAQASNGVTNLDYEKSTDTQVLQA